MLYVFHVDTGTMMTFDMNLAMERVSSLQGVIARGCRIPEEKQVLLISGGESLDPAAIVGKYHAGTDTNPIFLFSKTTIEAATPPSPSVNYGSDIDLQSQVEGSLLMPPAYETVVSRAQLALQFQDVDTEELRACERLIHDQHLQQQGWAAVVANLEDVTSELRQRSDAFHENYVLYLESRPAYRSLLASVSESLQLLSKIPVLQCLVRSSEETTDSTESLFDWISSQDTNHTLQDMVEQCDKATDQLDNNVGDALKAEVDQMFKEVHNDSMKEVKGLEDRLYGLDQIISGARKVVQEQGDLAQGFVLNQNRVSDLKDRSILPDLCSSHRNQLIEMLKNHARIRDIKKKCRMAKEELSVNLHTRLRWVMYVEKKICDVDGKLNIYLGSLKRLKKRLDILQQVHDAPTVYAKLLVEVVRRRKFSRSFLDWATTLADDSGRLHTEEVRRREVFLIEIGHHFLQAMFQGLEDYPPAFATESPSVFDHHLPDITVDDICLLKENVPELSRLLSVPAEDDLFQIIHPVKDSCVQWVDHPDQNIKSLPHKPSVTNSDIDIISMDRHQPYSIEGGSISLGDQFTECGEEIIQKPRFGSLSPPDKEFLLPKSLSEELTKQMKEEQKRLREKSGDRRSSKQDMADGRVEGDKSSLSTLTDVLSIRRCKLSSAYKTGTDIPSPDMETSQEFSTADFYIDESLPSSIESPPKTATVSKANYEQMLIEEKQISEKLQTDLKECNNKLSASGVALKSMRHFFDERLPHLKEIINEMKTQQFDDVAEFKKEFESVKENLIQVLKGVEAELNASNQNVIDNLVQEKSDIERVLNEKIAAESARCSDLEGKVKSSIEQLREMEESHKKEIEMITSDKADLGAKLADEVSSLTLKHELELEVELDKTRAEFEAKIANIEKEIEHKDSVIADKESLILAVKKEKIKLEESLLDRFQKEKDEICGILGIEYDEKLQKAIKEEQDKVEEIKLALTEKLKNEHEKDIEKKLDELKQSLIVQKDQAIEMTQSTLTLEHVKATDVIKQQHLDEKKSEFDKLKEELENKLKEDITKLSLEFNKEKGELVTELEKIKNKKLSDGEIQTTISMFKATHCDTQTDPRAELLETQVQTEVVDQSNISMQTEICEQAQLATQTDIRDSSNLYVQTESVQLTQLSTQTDVNQVSDTFVQTDKCEFKSSSDQSYSDVQIDGQKQDQSSTQTESVTQSQLATQTEHQSQDQSATQTDSVTQSQNATQTIQKEDTQSSAQTGTLEELQAQFDMKIVELEEKHDDEINKLIEQLERGKEDVQQLKSSLTSMGGEKQVRFNEAVNKVTQEKDRVIEELKNKEEEMASQLNKDKEIQNQLKEDKVKAEGIKERAMSLFKEKERDLRDLAAQQRHLESELGLAQQQVKQYQEQLQQQLLVTGSEMTESEVLSASPSVVNISDPEDQDLHQKIRDLEDEVRLKEEELSKMQQKVMELSMSASTRSLVQDKVSITSCHVGDLVLLCLDERLDQYVVFTVGATLHFLHTDCLVPLGLKSNPGDSKPQWLIAEVTDKEYCQAKKPNNRFKVPVSTKFYRVKAKKWSREMAQPSPSKKSDTASASTSS